MSAPRPHLVVAWSGADTGLVDTLLARDRLPGLAARLAAGARLTPLETPTASPFALAVTLASGASPARHGLLAPVQPSANGTCWQAVGAAHWPVPPVWDRLVAARLPAAAIGWPGSHGAEPIPRRFVVSDLELATVDERLAPLPPLTTPSSDGAIRVRPDDLDPALLGFFIPSAGLPPEPARDPLVRSLLRDLALLYSIHNTAVSALRAEPGPVLLAVHYPLPAFSGADLARHPTLREAAVRLLELLLADLTCHAATDANVDLVGLAPSASFLLSTRSSPPDRLDDLAAAIARELNLPTAFASPAPNPRSATEHPLLRRLHALATDPAWQPDRPPTPSDLRKHQAARGTAWLGENQAVEALPLLAPAFFQHPEDPARALSLFECLQQLGLREEAEDAAATLRDHSGASPLANLIEAELCLRRLGEPARALALLEPLLTDPTLGRASATLHREVRRHLDRCESPRARRPIRTEAAPAWDDLLEHAAERERLRAEYAAIRAAFVSGPEQLIASPANTDPHRSWTVRAVRAVELCRLPAALQAILARPETRRRWLRVLVAGPFARVVGAALLTERANAAARLDFAFAPGWGTENESVAALLRDALAFADSLRLPVRESQAALAGPATAWLEARGFHVARSHEVWRAPFEGFEEKRGAGIRRTRARRPVTLAPLAPAALPGARSLCARHRLLSPDRVALADQMPNGFDPRLSFIAGPAEAPVAVLLARLVGGQPYLEVLARETSAPQGPAAVGALLLAFARSARALGARDLVCAIDTELAADARRLLGRAGGERIDGFKLLEQRAA